MQGTLEGVGKKAARAAIGTFCALAFLASSAQAAAPSIQRTAVSGVTTTTALLEATIDPEKAPTRFHFEYGLQDCSVGPCTSVPAPEGKIPAEVKGTGDLTGKGIGVSEDEARTVRNISATAGAFGVGDAISGAGIPRRARSTPRRKRSGSPRKQRPRPPVSPSPPRDPSRSRCQSAA